MIVDFVCRGRRLIVEVDGGQRGERIHADQVRTKRLNRCGYRVIRFWNNEVLTNIDGVLLAIRQALQKNTIPLRGSVRGLGGCSQFDRCPGIPRSHRYARSRPLTLREGGVRLSSFTQSFPFVPRYVIPSAARNLPPSRSVRG